MLPPQGPPSPETQRQPPTVVDTGVGSHIARNGHVPPHVASTADPHVPGRVVVVVVVVTQSGPGPQQNEPPAGSTQMQSCSHTPFMHRSTVQGFSSSHSASVWHGWPGRVVLVVVVDGGGHSNTHT